ncbi:hypothetical protein BCT61_05560 [Vibrio breoganii]|nr:hypothetical protein BCT61_05560 [Vibrio breoganii]
MNILFLCTSNVNRSKTAEYHFSKTQDENTYQSAGLSEKYCKKCGSRLCSITLLEWADVVYVMEAEHSRRIERHTGEKYLHKVVNLAIDDVYNYMDPKLIELLVLGVSTSTKLLTTKAHNMLSHHN